MNWMNNPRIGSRLIGSFGMWRRPVAGPIGLSGT